MLVRKLWWVLNVLNQTYSICLHPSVWSWLWLLWHYGQGYCWGFNASAILDTFCYDRWGFDWCQSFPNLSHRVFSQHNILRTVLMNWLCFCCHLSLPAHCQLTAIQVPLLQRFSSLFPLSIPISATAFPTFPSPPETSHFLTLWPHVDKWSNHPSILELHVPFHRQMPCAQAAFLYELLQHLSRSVPIRVLSFLGVYFRLKLSWRRNHIQVAFHFLSSALTIILRDQWLRRWFPKMKATKWMISTKTKLTNPSLETTVLCKQLHTKNNKNTATRVGCTHLKGDMMLAYIRTTLQVFL